MPRYIAFYEDAQEVERVVIDAPNEQAAWEEAHKMTDDLPLATIEEERSYIVVVSADTNNEFGCSTCHGTGRGNLHGYCDGCHFAGVFKATDQNEATERAQAAITEYDDEGSEFGYGYGFSSPEVVKVVLEADTKKASA